MLPDAAETHVCVNAHTQHIGVVFFQGWSEGRGMEALG